MDIPERQLNHQIINEEYQSINYDKESITDQEIESISDESSEQGYSSDFHEDYDGFSSIGSEPERLEEDIVDKIIDAFTVKKRKAFIDQENKEDHFVSYETSEQRLLILGISFAIILTFSSTTLLIIQVPNWFQSHRVLVLEPKVPLGSQGRTSPHIIFLFKNGNIETFKPKRNWTLEHSWTFKVPQTQKKTGHFLYSSLNQLFIFYSDGQKDITLLNTNGFKNITHSKIKNSKTPSNFFYNPRFVQVGEQFWIFGGKTSIDEALYNEGLFEKMETSTKTLIWHMRRHVYYPGPKLPNKSLGEGQPISLNRTHVLILEMEDAKCIRGWVYSFQLFSWTLLKKDIYKKDQSLGFNYELGVASYFDKNVTLQILVMFDGDHYQNTNILEIVLLDGKSFHASRIELSLVCNYHQLDVLCKSQNL